jgi:hypothetical protein
MAIAFCICATDWLSTDWLATEMRTLWRGVVRTIFWSYERGTWPYDLMVVVIVFFVLLTPRSWFHDQPQAAAGAGNTVQVISQDSATEISIYRLDAAALPAEKRAVKSTPELERETHDILSRTVDDLKGRTFQVRRIDPGFATDGSVQYYDVTIHP